MYNYKLGNELGWEFYQIGFVKEPPPCLPKLEINYLKVVVVLLIDLVQRN
jgi:hypothetical protein